MDWKDTLLDYNEALILSHYSEQLERFAGEDGMKLWWAELLVFLNKQAKITGDIAFQAGATQVRIEERKRIGEWLDNFPHDSGDGYEDIRILGIGGVESLKRGELPEGA